MILRTFYALLSICLSDLDILYMREFGYIQKVAYIYSFLHFMLSKLCFVPIKGFYDHIIKIHDLYFVYF